jgi:hypothetical protein
LRARHCRSERAHDQCEHDGVQDTACSSPGGLFYSRRARLACERDALDWTRVASVWPGREGRKSCRNGHPSARSPGCDLRRCRPRSKTRRSYRTAPEDRSCSISSSL